MKLSIEYSGRIYVKYNCSKYFVFNQKKNGVYEHRLLHRDVWEDNFGEIPENHHIHHKDGNPLNNDPENLECVSRTIHAKIHGILDEWMKDENNVLQRNKTMWENASERSSICKHCGNEFTYVALNTKYFCSNNCRSNYHQYRERNQETYICVNCGTVFEEYKFRPRKFCSQKCMGEFKQKPKTFICMNCGKEFTCLGTRKRKYCSQECYKEHRKKNGVNND